MQLTALDQQLLNKKLNRLSKHLPTPFTCRIDVEHDGHHRTGAVVLCRINIMARKKTYHAERSAETLQDALDDVLVALRHELEREHSKHKDRHDV